MDMENNSEFIKSILSFSSNDVMMMTDRDGITSFVGASFGAFYKCNEILCTETAPLLNITTVNVYDIAVTSFICLVVTFLGRKLMIAIWQHIVLYLWKKLIKRFKKQ